MQMFSRVAHRRDRTTFKSHETLNNDEASSAMTKDAFLHIQVTMILTNDK
jgi:hypothetical protein